MKFNASRVRRLLVIESMRFRFGYAFAENDSCVLAEANLGRRRHVRQRSRNLQ